MQGPRWQIQRMMITCAAAFALAGCAGESAHVPPAAELPPAPAPAPVVEEAAPAPVHAVAFKGGVSLWGELPGRDRAAQLLP